jgi:hypothetical protein
MEHITDGLTIQDLTANATSAIASISPYLTLLLGILLAFYVISEIVNMLKNKDNKEEK